MLFTKQRKILQIYMYTYKNIKFKMNNLNIKTSLCLLGWIVFYSLDRFSG